MNKTTRIIIAVAVVAVAALAFIAKQNKATSPAVPVGADAMAATAQSPGANATAVPAAVVKAKLPRLVDLGASKCIPCKMMKPILDDLKANYTDHFSTEFIDVWENPDAGKQYGIRAIPTQIFFDAEGKELFRHEGFYGKDDMLNKWKELGVDVAGSKAGAGIVRETPVAADTRPRDQVCFMSLNGSIAALEPASAIAWFGQNKNAEGKWVSAGCFKQGFFVSEANLQKWLDARLAMTGRQITIAQALADKMKLSLEQIAKACKLGECK